MADIKLKEGGQTLDSQWRIKITENLNINLQNHRKRQNLQNRKNSPKKSKVWRIKENLTFMEERMSSRMKLSSKSWKKLKTHVLGGQKIIRK